MTCQMRATDLFRQYRESINPPYSRKDLLTIGATVFILLVLPLTVIVALQVRPFGQRASTQGVEPVGKAETVFLSNELLIKIKQESRGKIKEGNPADTGVASLNQMNKDFNVKKFERVAKVGRNSKSDAEVFAWYKVTMEGKGEKIAGKLEKGALKLTGKDPSNPAAENLQRLVGKYRSDPNIEVVEPNYIVSILEEATPSSKQATGSSSPTTSSPAPPPTTTATTTLSVPNDPYYSSTGSWGQAYPDLWGIKKINPEPAWDQTKGSASIIVAGIDTGVDRNHEDIKDNMWVNTAEIPNNGIDDDHNGYIDDYYGWDWANNDNDPMDDHGHGTHTVGTIAAVGNNGIGVVGVNWTSRIMALKFLSSGGSGYIDDGIAALQYAADMGARVSSNSWGCGCQDLATEDAIRYEHDKGMVMVAAAGNSSADALDFSPASADYAVTVAASDPNDALAYFSNWGEKIDVAAPGVDVLSLRAPNTDMYGDGNHFVPNGDPSAKYYRASGTSMATPHVAGLAALLLAKNPTLTNEEIRQIIRRGADDLGTAGKDASFGYGRINAAGSMSLTSTKPLTPIITSPKSRTVVFGTNLQILGSVPGPNFASYKIEVGAGRAPTSWITVANSNTQVINGVLATVDTLKLTEGANIFRLTTTDTAGKTYQFQVHDVDVDNFDAQITSPISLMAVTTVEIKGTAATKNGLGFSSYKLEWGVGQNPLSWSTTGITLANGGNQPVVNGTLGSWETTALTEGEKYTLRLTVNATNGNSTKSSNSVRVARSLIKGWPIGIPGIIGLSTPAVGDINNDGKQEVVIGTCSGIDDLLNKLYVFDYSGVLLPGWPVNSDSKYCYHASPALVDLDGDNKKEIIISDALTLYVYNFDGTYKPGWPKKSLLREGDGLFRASPAVADIDGDGRLDIVFAENVKIYAFHLDGSSLSGFPVARPGLSGLNFSSDQVDSSPVLADLDGDKKLEIIIGSRVGKVFVFNSTGQLLVGWPQSTDFYRDPSFPDAYDMPTAAVGELDKSYPGLEVVMPVASPTAGTALVYIWHKDGTAAFGAPFKIVDPDTPFDQNPLKSSPVLTDMDRDGNLEILFNWYQRNRQLKTDGTQLQNNVHIKSEDSSPALFDLNNDGKMEVIQSHHSFGLLKPTAWNLPIVDSAVPVWQFTIDAEYPPTLSPLVVDLDGNGTADIITADWLGNYYAFDTGFAVGADKAFWPQLYGNPQHTGFSVQPQTPQPPDTQSPSTPTNLTASAPAYNRINLAWNASTDNVGVAGYWIVRGGTTIASSPTNNYVDNTVNPSTTYNYQVIAYDAAGNNSGPSNTATVTTPVKPDTQVPTAPSNLTATVVSSTQINLAWTASTDDTGVIGYDVYRNSSKVASITTTSYGDTGLTPSTTYSYFVKAKDAAGNVSAASNTASATTQAPPTSTGNITGTVYSSAGGVVAGAKITFFVAGSRRTYYTSSSGNYTVTGLPAATYSLKFQAQGYVNQTVSATVTRGSTTTKDVTLRKR